MKTYQSHKKVQAAKIVAVTESVNGLTFTYADGHGETVYNDDPKIARYRPAVGDYLVQYADGYQSFSPAKAFEEGYSELDAAGRTPLPVSGVDIDAAHKRASVGDKVTKASIEARIAAVDFFVLPSSTVTICSITMVNGFRFQGENACIDPNEYDEQIGMQYAYDNAFNKIWEFEGYLRAERRFQREQPKIAEEPASRIVVPNRPISILG